MIIPNNIKLLMQQLLDNGKEAYIIGGAVRDTIMGIEPHDYDIFTNATGEEILEIFPQGKVIGGEVRQAKILTVIVDGVEVSQYRSNGNRTDTGTVLRDHLLTCDFTCNALACNINGEVYDVIDGQKHIADEYLVFVGDATARVLEDPLRLFRGIRFAAKYGLRIAQEEPFHNFKDYVKDLPKERIRDELLKIIIYPKGFELLNNFGMLEWIIPEWTKCKIDGGPHHKEMLNDHILLALNTARTYTNNPLLLLAVFLHDIGKPLSIGLKEDTGNVTFYNHHIIGKDYVKAWMREYRFSDDEIKYVTTIIEHHMMGKTGEISQRTFNSICNDLVNAKVNPEDMLVMTFSDNQANLNNPRLTFNEFITNNGFLQRYYETKYKQGGFDVNCLEITGKDIIEIGGFAAGPVIGKIKQKIFNDVSDGKVINRRDRLIEKLLMYNKEGVFFN